MDWYVNNKKEFDKRSNEIERIMEEKRKQIEILNFELDCYGYLLTTLKKIK